MTGRPWSGAHLLAILSTVMNTDAITVALKHFSPNAAPSAVPPQWAQREADVETTASAPHVYSYYRDDENDYHLTFRTHCVEQSSDNPNACESNSIELAFRHAGHEIVIVNFIPTETGLDSPFASHADAEASWTAAFEAGALVPLWRGPITVALASVVEAAQVDLDLEGLQRLVWHADDRLDAIEEWMTGVTDRLMEAVVQQPCRVSAFIDAAFALEGLRAVARKAMSLNEADFYLGSQDEGTLAPVRVAQAARDHGIKMNEGTRQRLEGLGAPVIDDYAYVVGQGAIARNGISCDDQYL